jgi:hypothetical protein
MRKALTDSLALGVKDQIIPELDQETSAWTKALITGLEEALALGFPSKVFYYLGVLSRRKSTLGHRLTAEERAALVALLYRAATSQAMDIRLQTRCAEVCTSLLAGKKEMMPDAPPALEWRRLWEALARVHLGPDCVWVWRSGKDVKNHGVALAKLGDAARRYFAPASTAEIVAEFEPLLDPSSPLSFLGAGMLSRLLPTTFGRGADAAGNRLLADLSWFDRYLVWWAQWGVNGTDMRAAWLNLLKRASSASRKAGRDILAPHVDTLFSAFTRILALDLGQPTPKSAFALSSAPAEYEPALPNPHDAGLRKWSVYYRIAVMSINMVHLPRGLENLEVLLGSVEHFCHPSNSGEWSERLAWLLFALCAALAKRVAREPAAIPAAHVDRVARVILPMLLQGVFSKNGYFSAFCERSFMFLGQVRPATTLAPVLERAAAALTNLNSTHQAPSVLSNIGALASLILDRAAFPSGAGALGPVLGLMLPGLDPNDPKKTVATVKAIVGILSVAPCLGRDAAAAASSAAPVETEEDAAALDMAMIMPEWGLGILDRVLLFVTHFEPPTKKLQDAFSSVLSQLNLLPYLLFSQMAEPTLDEALARVVAFIGTSPPPFSGRILGWWVAALAMAHPARTLAALVPLLHGKVASEEGGDAFVCFHLHLLASAVRLAGPAAVVHERAVLATVDAALTLSRAGDESLKVARAAGKVIHRLMDGCSSVYATEFRSVTPETWASAAYRSDHFLRWSGRGFHVRTADAQVQLHVPSAPELALAERVFRRYFDEHTAAIADAKPASVEGKKALCTSLLVLRSVCKGCLVAELPRTEKDLAEDDVIDDGDGDEDGDGEDPAMMMVTDERDASNAVYSRMRADWERDARLGGLSYATVGTPADRERVLAVLCGALDTVMTTRKDDVATISMALEALGTVASYRGPTAAKIKSQRSVYRALKSSTQGTKLRPRYLCVLRQTVFTHARLHYRALKQVPSRHPAYAAVVAKLVDVSTLNPYSAVRSAAQAQLDALALVAPSAVSSKEVVRTAIDRLDVASDAHIITGTTYLLCKRVILRKIASATPTHSRAVAALLALHSKEMKASVAARVQGIFLHLVDALPGVSASVSQACHPELGAASAADLAAAAAGNASRAAAGLAARARLRAALEASLSASSNHWRERLMGLGSALVQLAPADPFVGPALAACFARALIDEVASVSSVGGYGVRAILGYARSLGGTGRPLAGAEAAEALHRTPVITSASWVRARASPPFCSPAGELPALATWPAGFYLPTLPAPDASLLAACVDAILGVAYTQQGLAKLVETIQATHADTAEPAQGQQQTSNHFASSPNVTPRLLAGIESTWLRWPTSFGSFRLRNASLLAGLLEAALYRREGLGPAAMTEAVDLYIAETVTRAGKDITSRSAQTVAAEAWAGLARLCSSAAATAAAAAGAPWVARGRAACVEALSTVIESQQVESSDEWIRGLKYAVRYGLAAEQIAWIMDVVVRPDLLEADASSLVTRRLRFAVAAVATIGSAVDLWAARLLELVAARTAHPYASVRGHVALAVPIMVTILSGPHGRPGAIPARVLAQLRQGLAAVLTEGAAVPSLEDPDALHLAETAGQIWITAAHLGHLSHLEELTPGVLGCLLALSDVTDKEVAGIGRSALLHLSQSHLASMSPTLAAAVSARLADLAAGAANWRIRSSALQLLLECRARAVFSAAVIPSRPEALTAFDKALSDPQLEVRTVASRCLATLVRGAGLLLEPQEMDKMATRAIRLARKDDPAAAAQPGGDSAAAEAEAGKRHGRVLRLEALVMTCPYDVPSWLPAVLHELTKHTRDPMPISKTVKGTLSDFWRTHSEAWHNENLKEKFTEEQREALLDSVSAPSYYA